MKSHYIVDARPLWPALMLGLAAALTCHSATAVPLLVNGGFDDGADGWFGATSDANAGGWSLIAVGDPSPSSAFPTSADGGQMGTIAIADQIPSPTGNFQAATVALYQPFHVPDLTQSVVLSFDMYVNDWAGQAAFNPAQTGRVDIINASAPIFDTAAGVVFNAYIGTDGGPLPAPAVHREFELTPLVQPGEDYVVRFYVNSNLFWLNMGVDNVEIEAVVPEPKFTPAALLFVWVGAMAVFSGQRRSQCATRIPHPPTSTDAYDSSDRPPPVHNIVSCSP